MRYHGAPLYITLCARRYVTYAATPDAELRVYAPLMPARNNTLSTLRRYRRVTTADNRSPTPYRRRCALSATDERYVYRFERCLLFTLLVLRVVTRAFVAIMLMARYTLMRHYACCRRFFFLPLRYMLLIFHTLWRYADAITATLIAAMSLRRRLSAI